MNTAGFGLIGCGLWGGIHARTYQASPSARLVAVCDQQKERTTQFAGRFDAASSYTDWHDLLEDPAVEAVSIVTPDHTHTPILLAFLEAGKHVLVEKPLALTVADCKQILAARDAGGGKLMVDFHNRWNVPFVQVRRMVEDGALGNLLMINMRMNDTIYVPTQMLRWAVHSSPAYFLGTHVIDLIRWLSGAEVRRVYSVSRSVVLKEMGIDTPDYYQSILELSNGGTAVVENCWIVNTHASNVFDFKAEIIGTEGSTYINTSDHRMLEAYTAGGAALPDVAGAVDVYGKPTGFCTASIEHFIDCVVNDRVPLVTGEDGLVATRVVEAMQTSVQTGLPVDLGESW